MSPDRSHPRACIADHNRTRLLHRNRQAHRGRCQSMCRCGVPRQVTGVKRAGRGRNQYRLRACRSLRHHRRHPHRHRAVMRSVTTAAGRQAQVVTGFERPRQGPQSEVQNHENRDPAPHLISMLHDLRLSLEVRLPTPRKTCFGPPDSFRAFGRSRISF